MPGTYPRSSNPFFPFDRLKQIEREMNRFHSLTYSFSFEQWALSTVFTSFNDALAVAESLNNSLPIPHGGRYVVVDANKTLLWCRADNVGQATSEILAWSPPVASSGYIIVFVPDDERVITIEAYKARFGFVPVLLSNDKVRANYIHRYIKNVKKPEELRGSENLPILKLVRNSCRKCGEPIKYCQCGVN